MPDQITPATFSTPQFQKFGFAAGGLAVCFAVPLWRLAHFAANDELFSYILLMPFLCVYLAWQRKKNLPAASPPAKVPAALFLAAGAAALAGYFLFGHSSALDPIENSLALTTSAFLLFLVGAGCWLLGGAIMRVLVFPFCLLLFMVPLPEPVRNALESYLQHGSAVVADWMFALSGTPCLRNETFFHLPGMDLQVAPECSGIHSTWILFITSLVAGHMILRRPWKRAVLSLAVIPLALLRNGFRVFVIGQLCIHIGPQMIDSPIHHHGGPLFFVLSLVPFFLLLYFLKKSEGTFAHKPAP